jgi:hypothetical protein
LLGLAAPFVRVAGASARSRLGPLAPEVETGDRVRYEGRAYIVRGFTYASSSTQHVILQGEETREWKTVPLAVVVLGPDCAEREFGESW